MLVPDTLLGRLAAALQRRCNPAGLAEGVDEGSGGHAGTGAGPDGVRRPRRRPHRLRVVRRGRHDDLVPARRPDRAKPDVEGAGAVPVPALPGGHRRPPRQRAFRPADRARGVRRPGVRGGRGRRHGRARHRASGAGERLLQRLARPADRVPPSGAGAGSSGDRAVRAGRLTADGLSCRRGCAVRGGPAVERRVVQDEPALLAPRLARLRRVLLRPDLLRAALHQGVRGRRRLRPRHHGRGDGGRTSRARPTPGPPRTRPGCWSPCHVRCS